MNLVTLLLCHGNKNYSIKDLNPERTLTVDNTPTSEPDIVLDITKYTLTGCHIFDRVYMMFCPFSVGTKGRAASRFMGVVINIVKPSLKPGGVFYTPPYADDPRYLNKMMWRLGFKYLPYSDD